MSSAKIAAVLNNPENNPLYRCYCTIREMLADRGYTIPEPRMPVEEFQALLDKDDDDDYFISFTKHVPGESDWVMQIFFVTEEKFGPKMGKNEAQTFVDKMRKTGVQASIMVLHNIKLTSYAIAKMDEQRPTYWMEAFPSSMLQINITRHRYVPTHRLLTKAEQETILQKYSATVDQLQKISQDDRISRYFAAKPGQVFEITRDSETRGEYQTYRYVC